MKKYKSLRKLVVDKSTISNLSQMQSHHVHGGNGCQASMRGSCNAASLTTNPTTQDTCNPQICISLTCSVGC